MSLGITTGHAKLFVPSESLRGFDQDLFFRLVPLKDDSEAKGIGNRASQQSVVTVVSGGQELHVLGRPMSIESSMQGRDVNVVLPLAGREFSEAELSDIGVYIEHSDGTKQLLKGVLVPYNSQGDRGLQFVVDGFSLFALVQVPGLGETYEHEAYMNGYGDRTFRPDRTITRAEMAAILSRVTAKEAVSADKSYSDVNAGSWAKDAISSATSTGLMQGYPDGSFKPDRNITRAEMAKLAALLLDASPASGAGFADVSGGWAEDAILAVQGAGIMRGYEDGTFRPEQPLTRAEAVTVINRVLGRGPLEGMAFSPWKDVEVTHWAYRDIAEASVPHSYDQTDDGEQWAG
ncbi:S-layer homology domain-containing protein [Paenibacillus nanensis]|uniref:S-layer homology domain-containing protein n=1 Tax=Paenibacillus nanensis TaxID=393251 RepID=A0A3A1VGE4_9BACL|nr:S-layer homology domain-containing protein [Paenibacillus nanensis]RIX59394.1 S-layer homology domain-containing protein [Paenibacillus nanensis]